MTQKSTEPQATWGTIEELVSRLLGHADRTTADQIRRHAKPIEERSGLDSIPREFLRRTKDENGRYAYSCRRDEVALPFFRNLLALESCLGPSLTAKLLKRDLGAKELARSLRDARAKLAKQHGVYGEWLGRWEAVAERLTDRTIDPRRVTLFPEQSAPVAPSTPAALPSGLSLHFAKRLTELEQRIPHGLDERGVRAMKALNILALGDTALAASLTGELLAEEPAHAHANYAAALVAIVEAQEYGRRASSYHLQMQEAEIRHEEMWQDLAMQEAMKQGERRRLAFTRLAQALDHWPSTDGRQGRRYYLDDTSRQRALGLLLDLAFEFSHDYGNIDLTMWRRLQARRTGEELPAFFDDDTDRVLVPRLRELEERLPYEVLPNSVAARTKLLHAYFVVAPADYARYVPVWLHELKRAPAHLLEPALQQYRGNFVFDAIREHVTRALDEAGREELFGALEAVCLAERRRFFTAVRDAFKPPPEDDGMGDWTDDDGGFDL